MVYEQGLEQINPVDFGLRFEERRTTTPEDLPDDFVIVLT